MTYIYKKVVKKAKFKLKQGAVTFIIFNVKFN